MTSGAAEASKLGAQAVQVLQISGQALAYRDNGQERDSPPVVLLHGWGASLETVSPVQTALALELRVLAFDLPGFGQSEAPQEAWGSASYAEFIKQALDVLDIRKVSLIGHS